MRVLLGIAVVLACLLALAGWQLDRARSAERAERTAREAAEAAVAVQREQAAELARRLDALDGALAALAAADREGQKRLAEVSKAIRSIEKTEEDSDATMACLDFAVPVQLDRSLRGPGAGDRDGVPAGAVAGAAAPGL